MHVRQLYQLGAVGRYLVYVGPNVGGMAKGRAAAHGGNIKATLGQSHLQISTDDTDEFSEKEVADKIKKAAGANYDLGSNTRSVDGAEVKYQTQAGAIGKAAANRYKELEKETPIKPVPYETFARPKATPMEAAAGPTRPESHASCSVGPP